MTEEDLEDGDDVEKYVMWSKTTASEAVFSIIIFEKFPVY